MQARIRMATVASTVMTVLAAVGVSLAVAPPAHAAVISDIAYASAQPAGSRGHLLDLHLPSTGMTPRPLIIWHSGSAWTSDDSKAGAAEIAAIFNPLGFAVAGVNVRNSSQAIFPAQVHDIKAAIRYLRANAATYQLDTNRFAMARRLVGRLADPDGRLLRRRGGTGGHRRHDRRLQRRAHRARLLLADRLPADERAEPADRGLDHDSPASPESLLVGCPIQTCPAATAAANPMTYVDSGDPPLMFLHGQADFLVPHGQSVLLFNRIKAQCGNATFISVPAADHMMVQIMDPAQYGNETVRTTANCGETVSTGTLQPHAGPTSRPGCAAASSWATPARSPTPPAVWNGAFNGTATVRNTGTTPIQNWTLQWTWGGQPADQTATAWNATVTQVGTQVTARDAGHNSYIGPAVQPEPRLLGDRHRVEPHSGPVQAQQHRLHASA